MQNPELMDLNEKHKLLPTRPQNAHKGLFGHVVIVGGDEGMSGAIQLAGRAALRTGAGLVSLATRKSHAPYLNLTQSELMCHGVEDYKELQAALKPATVIALGPGLGQSSWARDLFQTALQTELPLVVDADGLNLLAQQPTHKSNWILTPHPKEAARLLNVSVSKIQNDRLAAAQELQTRFGGIVVLKGYGTLVCDNSETPMSICPYGNPGMASGGMGDALTGLIAGLLAQGLNLLDAAQLGVCLHASAGDKAAGNTPRGLLASDLIDEIRGLVN
jgi:NAD(P)H-hydrate epimerase